ncbi:MAG: beta-ketoacyl-ACP synthase II [Deltaproteobacteria bacterium]|nr:beta-ketoacyl-ACP synthase II [Deltaproteobacteria bacterium]
MERVVVTGMGVVSCVGNNVQAFWDSLVNGRSGIARVSSFDPSPLSSQIAGEVKGFEIDAKYTKRMARFSQFAFCAANEALRHAGLFDDGRSLNGIPPERIGVSVGTGIGGEPFLEEQHQKFLDKGPGRFHPLTVPIVITNMAAANVAIHAQLMGPNICLSTACATGNHSIGAALDQIHSGRADAMVAGGCESTVTPFAMAGYAQLKALSTRNDDPQGASRPFSLGRDGFVLSEGAGVLLLESLTSARKRGAVIYAELAGQGLSSDATHLTAPHPQALGAIYAIRQALQDARVNSDEVDYINAHGTSTQLNDALETKAIKDVFGPHSGKLMVSSIKSMVGHGLGAASALEAVASVLTLHEGVIPPTINLHEPDPALDLDFVPNQAREHDVRVLLSNSFAFGGHNAVLVFKKFE